MRYESRLGYDLLKETRRGYERGVPEPGSVC